MHATHTHAYTGRARFDYDAHLLQYRSPFQNSHRCESIPFPVKYDAAGRMLATADELGHVTVLDPEEPTHRQLRVTWTAHMNAIFDIKWSSDGRQILTASGDQTAALWDVETQSLVTHFIGHTGSIKSVQFFGRDGHRIVSGARDGSIGLWDVRGKNGVANPRDFIKYAHQDKTPPPSSKTPAKFRRQKCCQPLTKGTWQSVTCIETTSHHPHSFFSAGATDGYVKMWDQRKLAGVGHKRKKGSTSSSSATSAAGGAVKTPVLEISTQMKDDPRIYGITSLDITRDGKHLAVNTAANKILMYNWRQDQLPPKSFHGHINNSFFVRSVFSPDGRHILSGSSDNMMYIWNVNEPGCPKYQLEGHSQEINGVDWTRRWDGSENIASASDDLGVRQWVPLNQNENAAVVRKCGEFENPDHGRCRPYQKPNDLELCSATSPSPSAAFVSTPRSDRSSPQATISQPQASASTPRTIRDFFGSPDTDEAPRSGGQPAPVTYHCDSF
jgi:denticleless